MLSISDILPDKELNFSNTTLSLMALASICGSYNVLSKFIFDLLNEK